MLALVLATLIGTVTHIRDGDTLVLDDPPIRLDGIHAPEHGEPGGSEATAALTALVREAQFILLCRSAGYSSGDRLVAVCFTPDGRDIAAELIRMGVARDCPRFSGGRYAELEQPETADMQLPDYCE